MPGYNTLFVTHNTPSAVFHEYNTIMLEKLFNSTFIDIQSNQFIIPQRHAAGQAFVAEGLEKLIAKIEAKKHEAMQRIAEVLARSRINRTSKRMSLLYDKVYKSIQQRGIMDGYA